MTSKHAIQARAIQELGGGLGISIQEGARCEGDWQNQFEVISQSTRQIKIHYSSSKFWGIRRHSIFPSSGQGR